MVVAKFYIQVALSVKDYRGYPLSKNLIWGRWQNNKGKAGPGTIKQKYLTRPVYTATYSSQLYSYVYMYVHS